LTYQRKFPEAEATLREALTLHRELRGELDPKVASALSNLAFMFTEAGKLAEAEAAHREALAVWRKVPPSDDPGVLQSLDALHKVLTRQGKAAEAEAVAREALAVRRKALGDEHSTRAVALADRAIELLRQERFAEAEPLARECLAIREKTAPDDWVTVNTRNCLGECLLGQQKYQEAESLLVSAYEGLMRLKKELPAHARAYPREAAQRLVQLYEATGRPEKAAEWTRKLAESE
jgi:non-specific serine/threonine protein kinase/serine/threonine-protein kinase